MTKKKKYNYIKLLITILFGIYLAIYFSFKNGYYDYIEKEKNILTEEKMKEFELDIKNGKDINLENYIEPKKDYTNVVSKIGVKTGEASKEIITKSLETFIKVIGTFVTN